MKKSDEQSTTSTTATQNVPSMKSNERTPVNVVEPLVRERPVEPSEEVHIDGLFVLPNVDDESYMPTSQVALSQAAYALVKKVPVKQMHKFYVKLKKLTQDSIGWQQKEEMNAMGSMKESQLRQKIKKMLSEAPIVGNNDFEDEPTEEIEPPYEGLPEFEPSSEEKDKFKRHLKIASAAQQAGHPRSGAIGKKRGQKVPWSNAQLAKKKKPVEFFDKPGYEPEIPEEELKNQMRLMPYDEIAKRAKELGIDDLNTNSAVKQFLEDPRKLSVMDKVRFAHSLRDPDAPKNLDRADQEKWRQEKMKEFERFFVQVPAKYLNALERGDDWFDVKSNLMLDPAAKATREIIKHYASDLETEGLIEKEDVKDLLSPSAAKEIVQLDSFKKYAIDYLDNNADTLWTYDPFREFSSEYWTKKINANKQYRAYMKDRAEKDIARGGAVTAARKAKKASAKGGE